MAAWALHPCPISYAATDYPWQSPCCNCNSPIHTTVTLPTACFIANSLTAISTLFPMLLGVVGF
uniref:Uncharacterized protein n=1 Tax=Anguilla anguilla TaxID=7936 RepID=A0A0E9TUS5_ANGAN